MDTEVDLTTVDRDVLIAIIAELQAVIERLPAIAELEGETGRPAPNARPQLGPEAPSAAGAPQAARHGFARPRMTPTHRVEHGGELSRLRRPPVRRLDPAHSGGHRAAGGSRASHRARLHCSTCPACRRRAHLRGTGRMVLGPALRQPASLIATLREEGRLPIRSVQWYLDTVHQLRLSVGAIVAASGPNRQWPHPGPHSRWSPETGWREDGPSCGLSPNLLPAAGSGQGGGERWASFSGVSAFLRRSRPQTSGPTWRDIHDQAVAPLARWADAVPTTGPKPTHPQAKRRDRPTGPGTTTGPRPALPQPVATRPSCADAWPHQRTLSSWEPAVPSDNNAAERSLRHLSSQDQAPAGVAQE